MGPDTGLDGPRDPGVRCAREDYQRGSVKADKILLPSRTETVMLALGLRNGSLSSPHSRGSGGSSENPGKAVTAARVTARRVDDRGKRQGVPVTFAPIPA